ncbi:MAG: hypothetical protein CSA35_07735 [Dethiosulfovibrio peptidovorans]|nr:MAG: hypothetical protein CSA35_07735 [Dethiosulfovibrio peptidovorans]
MYSLPAAITECTAWSGLMEALNRAVLPSAVALVIPEMYQRQLLWSVARFWLCRDRTCCGQCPSCLAWSDEGHPDLLIVGEDGPPSVNECRRISDALRLYPVVSSRRIAAILCADQMNLNAANSMLKIAEEPPSHGHVFFLMERDGLITTLRSRSWFLRFPQEELIEALPVPDGEAAWLTWIARVSQKAQVGDLLTELRGMEISLTAQGRLKEAAGLSQLVFLAARTHLSATMVADLAYLLIKEEYPFELISDHFR